MKLEFKDARVEAASTCELVGDISFDTATAWTSIGSRVLGYGRRKQLQMR